MRTMAQDLLAPTAPLLPVLDLDRPTFLESQPLWLASRITAEARSENRRIIRDENGRQISEVRTLPASLMLTGSMRAVLERRVAELEVALLPGPPEGIIESVGRLLNRYLRNLADDDLAIRAETYLDALDGLPGWTVSVAVRRWFGGKCGGTLKDYDFAPSEARLRSVADRLVEATKGQVICFRRLLVAEPEREVTEADRLRQAAELKALSIGLRSAEAERAQARRPIQAMPPIRSRAAVAAELEQRRIKREAETTQAELDVAPGEPPEYL
jgi:hypothetical protein